MGLTKASQFGRHGLFVWLLALSCFVVILKLGQHADGYLIHSETHSKALITKRESGDEELVVEDDSSAAAGAAAAAAASSLSGSSSSASAAAAAAGAVAGASASASSSASASASAMSRGSRGALTESKKRSLKDKNEVDTSSSADEDESGGTKRASEDADDSSMNIDEKKVGSRSDLKDGHVDEDDNDDKKTTTFKPRAKKRTKKPKHHNEDEADSEKEKAHKETDENGEPLKGESRSFGSLFSGLMKGKIGGSAKLGGSLGGGLLGGAASLEGGLSAGAEASATGEADTSAMSSSSADAEGSTSASASGLAGASGSLTLGSSASASVGGKPLLELTVKDKKSIKAVERAGGEADAHGGAKLDIGVNATLGGGLLPKLPLRAHGSIKLNANSKLVGEAIDKIMTDIDNKGKALGGLRANATATLGKLLDPLTNKLKPLEFKTKEELHENEKVVKTVSEEIEAIIATSTTKKPKSKPITTTSRHPAPKSRQYHYYGEPNRGGHVNHTEWNNNSSTTNDTSHHHSTKNSSGSSTITHFDASRTLCKTCTTKKPWPLWWPLPRTTTTTSTSTTTTARPKPTMRQAYQSDYPHHGGHVNHTVWNDSSSTTNNTSHYHTSNSSSGSQTTTHYGGNRVISPTLMPLNFSTASPTNPQLFKKSTQIPVCRRQPSPCDYKELKESDKMLAVVVTKRGGFRGRRLSTHAIRDIMGHNLSQQEHMDLTTKKTIELSVNNSFVLPAGTYYFPRAVRVVGFDLHT